MVIAEAFPEVAELSGMLIDFTAFTVLPDAKTFVPAKMKIKAARLTAIIFLIYIVSFLSEIFFVYVINILTPYEGVL